MDRKCAALIPFCLSSLLITVAVTSQAAKVRLNKVGLAHRRFTPREPYDWRGAKTHALVTDVWYPAEPSAVEQTQYVGNPANPFAIAGKAAPDAPFLAKPAQFPLILLSHGTGGSSQIVAWFGAALAARGYIVAGVNHPASNTLEDTTTPRHKDLLSGGNAPLTFPSFSIKCWPTQISALTSTPGASARQVSL